MNDDKIRVIKIGRDALFEFIYESFIDGQKDFLDVDPLKVTDSFMIDWDRGEFIFCAYNVDDVNGKMQTPKINLQKLIETLPNTTDTMYKPNRYREFTMEELEQLSE